MSSHILTHSPISFELSDRGAVTRKVAQNTRPSFSHVRWGGGGGGGGGGEGSGHVIDSVMYVLASIKAYGSTRDDPEKKWRPH